ncbi:hypothetical protein Y032_0047g1534 [Ancylostoma ceylanicum]|uniref:Uncharacterized protein n=2 Tax=Ancylostoma ceylanicum TaxID=53326 RepID=A0A016UB75_9BILA|nr:hypothetical protein Y032_0047g1534 [Ancylostoma ceylanicum]
MQRKTSPGRKDEKTTKESNARMEERMLNTDQTFDEWNGKNEKKTVKKESKLTDEEKKPREVRRGSADKGRATQAKKVAKDGSGTSEEKKTKQENKNEDKVPVKETRGAVEVKMKRQSSVASDEKPPKKDAGAQSLQGKGKPKDGGQTKYEKSPVDSPNLESHAEAIHERRMSLPRTIVTDPAADVEIVIGDDGKPVFHPTITPKAEEILQELTDIILADEKKEERAPKFIHA